MGLNKYGKKGYEDVSDWTPIMIVAKICEIENVKQQAYKEYIDYCAMLDEQVEYLQQAISNKGILDEEQGE